MANGDPDEARMSLYAQDFYGELRGESPNNPTGYYGQALILAMTGNTADAEL